MTIFILGFILGRQLVLGDLVRIGPSQKPRRVAAL